MPAEERGLFLEKLRLNALFKEIVVMRQPRKKHSYYAKKQPATNVIKPRR